MSRPGQGSRYSNPVRTRESVVSAAATRRVANRGTRSAINRANYSFRQEELLRRYIYQIVAENEAKGKEGEYPAEDILNSIQQSISDDALDKYKLIKNILLSTYRQGHLLLSEFIYYLIALLKIADIFDNMDGRIFTSKNASGKSKKGIIKAVGNVATGVGSATVIAADLLGDSTGIGSAVGHGLRCIGEQCATANTVYGLTNAAVSGQDITADGAQAILNTTEVPMMVRAQNPSASASNMLEVGAASRSGGFKRKRKTRKSKHRY